MRYAKLIKLAGELIEANAADYSDYRGFLRCPECGEPVFLRSAHQRQEREVAAAFIHHRAIPLVSQCELRVGGYSSEEVQRRNAQARGQRLQKLRISLWKILKTNVTMDFKPWSAFMRDAKENSLLAEVAGYGREILRVNPNFILHETFDRLAQLMIDRSPQFHVDSRAENRLADFLRRNEKDWPLHCKIAKEALEFFLVSNELDLIQYRVAVCMCHPAVLSRVDPLFIELDVSTKEWRSKFGSYLTLQICFVFLGVDWLEVFEYQVLATAGRNK